MSLTDVLLLDIDLPCSTRDSQELTGASDDNSTDDENSRSNNSFVDEALIMLYLMV